jgi:hypothetical protein
MSSALVFAQEGPADPSIQGSTGVVGGGAAALAGGVSLLVGLAAGYAGLKLYRKWLEKKQTITE